MVYLLRFSPGCTQGVGWTTISLGGGSDWGRTCFPTHCNCWLNSFPCFSMTESPSFLLPVSESWSLVPGGHPQLFFLWTFSGLLTLSQASKVSLKNDFSITTVFYKVTVLRVTLHYLCHILLVRNHSHLQRGDESKV